MTLIVEKVAKVIFDILCPGIRYLQADKEFYCEAAKATIETIISEIHHEAQDTEFDKGFEAFRNQLKEALK